MSLGMLVVLYQLYGDDGSSSDNLMITEGSDNMITEGSDGMITEQ